MISIARRPARWSAPEAVLALVDGAIGVAAVAGGIGLIVNGLGMPKDWLLSTPFDTWTGPGVLLAVGIGGSQLVAAGMLATHDERARSTAILAGVGLAAWIVVQWMVLRRFHPMQPAMFAVGVGTAALASRLPRPAPTLTTRR